MIRIGDFSKVSRVSIKTLRYYDEMGLLNPISVDQATGYRFYSMSQLPRLNRILALKDLGFSLEQIAYVLNENLSVEQLRGMLRLKRAELQQYLNEGQERLTRIEARLTMITQENTMSDYEVLLKQVEPQLVAGVRDTLADYADVGHLCGEVAGYVAGFGTSGLTGAIWHNGEYKTSDVDGEAIVFLKEPLPASERVKVYDLPAATMASIIHKGSYNDLRQAYEAVLRWIEANGYTIAGPERELYLYCTQPVKRDDESYVTEIQFPVVKG